MPAWCIVVISGFVAYTLDLDDVVWPVYSI